MLSCEIVHTRSYMIATPNVIPLPRFCITERAHERQHEHQRMFSDAESTQSGSVGYDKPGRHPELRRIINSRCRELDPA